MKENFLCHFYWGLLGNFQKIGSKNFDGFSVEVGFRAYTGDYNGLFQIPLPRLHKNRN